MATGDRGKWKGKDLSEAARKQVNGTAAKCPQTERIRIVSNRPRSSS